MRLHLILIALLVALGPLSAFAGTSDEPAPQKPQPIAYVGDLPIFTPSSTVTGGLSCADLILRMERGQWGQFTRSVRPNAPDAPANAPDRL
jgi:hypothetical protein